MVVAFEDADSVGESADDRRIENASHVVRPMDAPAPVRAIEEADGHADEIAGDEGIDVADVSGQQARLGCRGKGLPLRRAAKPALQLLVTDAPASDPEIEVALRHRSQATPDGGIIQ